MPQVQLPFEKFLSGWHRDRQLARTDLLWLCNEVLGYEDVSRRVHGPILDCLQHFPGAIENHRVEKDYIAATGGKILWTPRMKMEHLPANEGFGQSRDSQYLYPRGHLKSTVITIAHSIQWMVNYPNVRILLTTATELLGQGFIIEIRNHFIQNEYLRFLFPDICPVAKDGKIAELGNLGGFTLPCRDNTNKKLGPGGKEPTLQASTVGSSITGYHGDVQKNDDLVEKVNSSSQGGIDAVIRHFGTLWDLLEKYNALPGGPPLHGWQDTVGTPWDFSDLYQVRRNDQAKRIEGGLEPTVNMIVASAAPNWPDGPFLWPERMGYEGLKAIEDDSTKGPAQLSAQYLMNPNQVGSGLIEDIKKLRWMRELEMGEIVPQLMLKARMDPAGMEIGAKGVDNDYTALTVAGFGDGTLYVPYLRHGRPTQEESIEWIFDLFTLYPQLVELVVEKSAGGSAIEPWFLREMSSRGRWLPVRFEKRSNREAKVARISGLRSWFQRGQIVLSEAIAARGYRTMIESEIRGFPKYRHDDFLDTLSDLMRDSSGGVTGEVVMGEVEISSIGRVSAISGLLAEMDRFSGGPEMDDGYNRVTGFSYAGA